MDGWPLLSKQIIKYSDCVRRFTQPLRTHFNIAVFFYMRIEPQGVAILSDRPDWSEYYAENQLYLKDQFLKSLHKIRSGFSFFPTTNLSNCTEGKFRPWRDLFHLNPGVLKIKRTDNLVELFEFATDVRDGKIGSLGLGNIREKDLFCGYFKKEVRGLVAAIQKIGIGSSDLGIEDQFKLHSCRLVEEEKTRTAQFLTELGYKNDLQIAEALSPRERECLLRIVQGKSAKQIGNDLDLSPRTVEFYLENIKNKTSSQTRQELIAITNRLGRLGLLDLEEREDLGGLR